MLGDYVSAVISYCCDEFAVIATDDCLSNDYYHFRERKLYTTPIGYCSGVGLHDDIIYVKQELMATARDAITLSTTLEHIKQRYEKHHSTHNSYVILSVCKFLNGRASYHFLEIGIISVIPYVTLRYLPRNQCNIYAPHGFMASTEGAHLIKKWEQRTPPELSRLIGDMGFYIDCVAKLCPKTVSNMCYFGINSFIGSGAYKIQTDDLQRLSKRANAATQFFLDLSSFRIEDE